MLKTKAIELLGGTVVLAADAIGISYQAVDKWPDDLPDRIADRVLAAQARKHLPPELIGAEAPTEPPDRRKADLESAGADGLKLVDRRVADKLSSRAGEHEILLAAKTAGVL